MFRKSESQKLDEAIAVLNKRMDVAKKQAEVYEVEKTAAALPPIVPPSPPLKAAPVAARYAKTDKGRRFPAWLGAAVAAVAIGFAEFDGMKYLAGPIPLILRPYLAFIVHDLFFLPLAAGLALVFAGVMSRKEDKSKKQVIEVGDFIEQVNDGAIKLDLAAITELSDTVNKKAVIYGKKLVVGLEEMANLRQPSPEGLV